MHQLTKAALNLLARFLGLEPRFQPDRIALPRPLRPFFAPRSRKPLKEAGKVIQKLQKKFIHHPDLTETEAKFIKDVGLLLRRPDSKPARQRILRYLKELLPTSEYARYRRYLQTEEGVSLSNQDLTDALRLVVHRLTGQPGYDITDLQQRRQAKERNPELYAEFLKLRRQLKDRTERIIEDYFVKHHRNLVPVEELRHYLRELGLPDAFPKGLKDVLVDIHGNYYTKEGEPIDGRPPASARVVMNTSSGDFVLKAVLPNGTVQYYYPRSYKEERTAKKFESILPHLDRLDGLTKKWRRYLDSPKPLVRSLATLVELLYQTQGRVGSKVPKSERKGGFGLSTLKVKHVKFRDDGSVVLSYKGKKGIRQRHVLKPTDDVTRRVVRNLKALVEGKDHSDFLFSVDGRRVSARLVNKFLKKIGVPFTAHKFRHIVGTLMARELLLGKRKRFKDRKQAEAYFKKALTKIGKVLGHKSGEKVTWTTAKDNYIDPSVMFAFFERYGFRPPTFLTRKFRLQ